MDTLGMEIAFFFVAQSIIIIGAILTAYVRTQVAIARLQADVANVHAMTGLLKDDHGGLANKVDGVSRKLARVEGALGVTK